MFIPLYHRDQIQDMKRRHAAVVFNDISGYTSLMQKNEELAVRLRQRHKEVVDRLTREHHGTIIQYYGDGTLSIYDHSMDAVKCAMAMQKEFNNSPVIPLRIGIHAGEILLGPDGVYGDCVNIASRIERICVPGSVLVSSKVVEEIRGHEDIITKDLGQFELKNVRSPMNLHAVINEGIRVPDPHDLAGKIGFKEKTVMVLPFYNLSNNPDDDFFSDGITEQIIYELSELDGIRVTSRTSSFTFKDKQINLRQLHQEMGIDHVVEGSVRRHGKKVRITAQLISAADDFHLWSETYTREVSDVFQLQDEIASMIANKLKAGFQQSYEKRIVIPREEPDQMSDGIEFYHKGRYEWKHKNPGYIERTIQYFKKSIEADKEFYPVWPALAKAYAYKGYYNLMPPDEAARLCLECIRESERLDRQNIRTQNALALYHTFFTWDWKAALSHLELAGKAQEQENFILNNSVLHTSGIYLMANNQLEKAVHVLQKGARLDPMNVAIQMELAKAFLFHQEHKKSLNVVNALIQSRPDALQAIELKAWILFTMGKQREGIEAFESFRNLSSFPVCGLAGLSYAYARTLRMKEAAEKKEMLAAVSHDLPSHLIHLDMAIAHLGAQEYEEMFEQLFFAARAKMPGLIFIESNPVWDEIRRFNDYRELKGLIFPVSANQPVA